MKSFLTTLLLSVLFLQGIIAQPAPVSIPETATKTVEKFTAHLIKEASSDSARLRFIYDWITGNVRYDVERLGAIKNRLAPAPQSPGDVLKSRNAVCQGYADLFVALCTGVGIEARTVPGYAKIGGVISPVAHAWTAARLGNQWYLFDPTWGAGYLQEGRFVKAYNPRFFMVRPEESIRDHMPFDPIFQFLSLPLNNREFIDGAAGSARAEVFAYKDSLAELARMTELQKSTGELRRLEAAGIQHPLLAERQRFLKTVIQSAESKAHVDEGGEAYGRALKLYGDYVAHKNSQFTTIEEAKLRALIDDILGHIRSARTSLLAAVPKTAEQKEAVQANAKSIESFRQMTLQEKAFVERYFTTDKSRRQKMFVQGKK